MAQGKVYLIGAGPGDPGLITVRGREVLEICDVVLYDALAHPALLSCLRPGASAEFVGKRGGEESEPQESITRRLLELAREGKTVGRLKGGDPLLFARGAEEALALAEQGVPFEIVPGIPSPVAVAAYAGIPLTHRDLASSVLFLTGTPRAGAGPDGHDWRRLATRAGTICVLMGMRRLREIADSLIENGRPPETPTAVVQWGARPEQRTVVAPLRDIADRVEQERIGSPALVIIGPVVTLREQLRWFDNRPLFGKRVLVTRAREQASVLSRRLREEGAAPVEVPTIALHPSPDPERLARAAREVRSYDWLALTSPNGVARFFEALDAQHLDARALGDVRVAAVGPGTAAALRERGIKADLVPKEFHGEALAEALLAASQGTGQGARVGAGQGAGVGAGQGAAVVAGPGAAAVAGRGPRVLLPRALVARDVFPERIRAAGGEVDVVAAYETRAPGEETRERLRGLFRDGAIDLVTLTSSSTVTNLLELLGDEGPALLAGVTLASIGPITTTTAEKAGLQVAITAASSTIEGLIEAMKAHTDPG